MTRQYLVTNSVVNSGTLVLTCSNTPTFSNTRCFKFKICPRTQNAATTVMPVTMNMLIDGSIAAVALWDKYGNVVNSNTLYTGVTYCAFMGTGTDNHLIIQNTPLFG